jgi:hypothetical protein
MLREQPVRAVDRGRRRWGLRWRQVVGDIPPFAPTNLPQATVDERAQGSHRAPAPAKAAGRAAPAAAEAAARRRPAPEVSFAFADDERDASDGAGSGYGEDVDAAGEDDGMYSEEYSGRDAVGGSDDEGDGAGGGADSAGERRSDAGRSCAAC